MARGEEIDEHLLKTLTLDIVFFFLLSNVNYIYGGHITHRKVMSDYTQFLQP